MDKIVSENSKKEVPGLPDFDLETIIAETNRLLNENPNIERQKWEKFMNIANAVSMLLLILPQLYILAAGSMGNLNQNTADISTVTSFGIAPILMLANSLNGAMFTMYGELIQMRSKDNKKITLEA